MSDLQNKKILVVDDEADILEIVTYNLRKEGFILETASDGRKAIEAAKSFRPDLILLDIMMPEMDGIEVCRVLRRDNDFEETIIAFLTARSEDYTQISALDVGGDDFINKPINLGILVSRVKALLRRSIRTAGQSNSRSKIVLGDLTIDREQYKVINKGINLDLPRKEFELLHLLASRPGKVFTREEIFTKIWGTDVIVGPRTIDVHVRKLREKLGDKLIKTLKGIGYKFDG